MPSCGGPSAVRSCSVDGDASRGRLALAVRTRRRSRVVRSRERRTPPNLALQRTRPQSSLVARRRSGWPVR